MMILHFLCRLEQTIFYMKQGVDHGSSWKHPNYAIMIAQLKYNVITFNGRLSIPGVAYFLFLLPLFKYFFPKTLEVTRKSRNFANE